MLFYNPFVSNGGVIVSLMLDLFEKKGGCGANGVSCGLVFSVSSLISVTDFKRSGTSPKGGLQWVQKVLMQAVP